MPTLKTFVNVNKYFMFMEQMLFFLPRTQSKQSFLNDLLHLWTDICNMLSLRNSVLCSFFNLFFYFLPCKSTRISSPLSLVIKAQVLWLLHSANVPKAAEGPVYHLIFNLIIITNLYSD